MNREEAFERKLSEIQDSDLIERVSEELSQLCQTGGRSITMSVPPSISDTDMLIGELIRRYENYINNK